VPAVWWVMARSMVCWAAWAMSSTLPPRPAYPSWTTQVADGVEHCFVGGSVEVGSGEGFEDVFAGVGVEEGAAECCHFGWEVVGWGAGVVSVVVGVWG
jgi:hypothetical protein